MEPNINGFTLKGLKTMMGRDGYMVNCTLLFNGSLQRKEVRRFP